MSNRTKKSSKGANNSSGFKALFRKFAKTPDLSISRAIIAIPTIEPTLLTALNLSPIVPTSQVKDTGSLVSAFVTEDETSLKEFQTSIKLEQDLLDRQTGDNTKQPLKAVRNAMFQAGSNMIVVKETADEVLSVGKEVNEVLSKMIQLASQVAEIGEAVPFIAPAFKILKIIIDVEQKARDADEKCQDLMERIYFMVSHMLVLKNIKTPGMLETFETLETTLGYVIPVLREAAALSTAYRKQSNLARRLKVWNTPDFQSMAEKIKLCSESLILSLQIKTTMDLSILKRIIPKDLEAEKFVNDNGGKEKIINNPNLIKEFAVKMDIPMSNDVLEQMKSELQDDILKCREQIVAQLGNLGEQMTMVIDMGAKTLKLLESTSPVPPTMDQVRTALQDYYKKELHIQRISGGSLPLESCYINLAIVEAPEQRKADTEELKMQAQKFHRMSSYEKIVNSNVNVSFALEDLFNQRKLRNGSEYSPNRILIQGRAGIGKSTLCKKLIYAFQNGLWKDRFDVVLWIPLRQLKGCTSRNLGDLLCEKYFARHPKPLKDALAQALDSQTTKTLFVLDGLDEIITDPSAAQGTLLSDFLQDLLGREHVILTSRPSGVESSTLKSIDLELETVGFSQQDVQEYLRKVEPKAATEIQNFIDQTPFLQGLVNIPVQLDALCYSWDLLSSRIAKDNAITITTLYVAMVTKLWSKDGPLLEKKDGGQGPILSSKQILDLPLPDIEIQLFPEENEYLCYLAFQGFQDNRIEFDTEYMNRMRQELNKHHTKSKKQRLSLTLTDGLKCTSFLHTASANSKASGNK
ncbi:hypothetical protein BGX27_011242, partial [Mortierella sp. AM989]